MSIHLTPKFLTGARRPGQFPEDAGAEVAFVGRSNSGKSSVINAITGRRALARTSKLPGRTREINFFAVADRCRIVDLPGYGYAKVAASVRREWGDLLDAYFRDRRSLRGLFVTLDVRRDPNALDETMIDWSRAAGVPAALLLTKADKLSRSAALQRRREIASELDTDLTLTLFSVPQRLGAEDARNQLSVWLAAADAAPGKK
jgi:GTP-binding protein